MALGISQDRATQALMGNISDMVAREGDSQTIYPIYREGDSPQASDVMLGGLGLGGLGFAAQTGRAPAPTPMGATMSPLAQQVAANDAANRLAAGTRLGGNLPANPANPALGPRGGTAMPPQPSLATARQAAAGAARQAAPTALARGSSLLGPAFTAGAGGYTVGSILDKAFDISGNIARGLFPDAPTLTREERAALGQPGVEAVSDMVARPGDTEERLLGDGRVSGLSSTDRSAPEQVVQAGRLRGRGEFVNPLAGQTVGGEFIPAEPTITTAPLGPAAGRDSGVVEAPTAPAMDAINDVMSRAGVPTQDQLVSAIQAQAPTAPTLPEGVEPGSPQATFLAERAKGKLSPAQIAQAQEFAASMGTTFDPETGYSREPFLQYQAARGMGLRTDPQGRMIPAGFATRAEAFPEYESEAATREARIAARPDFGVAQPVESRRRAAETGIPTDAELRDLAQARMPGATEGQIARGMKVASRYGIDPLTGKRKKEKTEVEKATEQARLDLIRAQVQKAEKQEDPEAERIARETAQARLDLINKQIEAAGKEDPDKLTRVTTQADRLIELGILPEGAKQGYILDQMGADIDEILGAGITTPTPEGAGKDSLGLGL